MTHGLKHGIQFHRTDLKIWQVIWQRLLAVSYTHLFVESEYQHEGIHELIVTKDMPERKAKMIELGDAFIAFPGGTGTLEEISEIMSMISLKHMDAPCILYNLHGYYDGLKTQLDTCLLYTSRCV